MHFEVHALSSCQVAVGSAALCPYGVHAHVEKEYHDRTRKLDSELYVSQQDQRGSKESELYGHRHRGRVLAPVIGQYGGASSDLSLILVLVGLSLGKWLANTRLFTTLAFQKPKPCSDGSLHANGVTQLLGDGRLFFWIA